MERHRQWASDNKDRRFIYEKKRVLKQLYGMTLDKYDDLAKSQNYKCKICFEHKKLFVDHCHKTKVVRGLLCSHCNLAIGLFFDDPQRILRAVHYVEWAGMFS